ncbi:MAG: hypothetical protein A3G83_10915 [Betaproteobacteria bacterium RIFCSPLOWO2_12_FULL_68_20]|nr:MAG: hypothetical protein A3G83_10915 [Betaproteobacteria bacterium RIFCSPLOWO2_12_FULL_68_20]
MLLGPAKRTQGGIVGKSIAIAVLAAALGLAAPYVANAAGLGRLSVQSALGQPLNAEIELTLQPGEEEGLIARLPSMSAFTQAGIEFNPALASVRFAIERRDGRAVLKLTTTQPVNEPFLDLLVELQWATGRLIREYTFLLDPPEYKGPQPIAAAPAAPEAKPEAAPAPAPRPALEAKPLEVAPAPQPVGTYEVKKDDTLGAIARRNLPPGVTLNQMLMALFRANREAFIRDNINLVRAGRILSIPDGAAISSVDPEDAKRLVQAHMADFAEYRSRLAAAPTAAEAAPGQREVAGRIAAKPEAPAPAAPKDELRLSKADPKKPGAPGARAAREDDLAARGRALTEAQSRVTELEKNVSDLQKLLELKNQQLAELEKKAGEKPAPAAPAPIAKAPEKPAAAPEAPKPVAEAPKPAAEAPKPAAEAPKPAAPAAKAIPKAKPAAPPPPEPSIIDEFLDNPLALGGLGGVVVLLAGYGAWAWSRKKKAQAKFQDSVLGAAAGGGPSMIGAAADAPAAGGVSQVSVSEAPAAAMEAEEVDPIAEADVYMAYGRDAQAEEILKEALQKDPNRAPVHAKLLEIYANRRDAKAFEQSALKFKGLTGGSGPEWDKAAALGRSIDPNNGLYGGSGQAAAPAVAAAAAPAAAAPALDFDLGGPATQSAPTPDITLEGAPKEAAAPGLDFDLGAAAPAQPKTDFTPEGTLIVPERGAAAAGAGGLDFDLDLGTAGAKMPEAPAAAPADQDASGSIDFDLNLDLGGAKPQAAEPATQATTTDLSAISLDLGAPGEAAAATSSTDPKWQEVATKLDLAKAYEEMGDKDGARELLNEVMKEGDAAQKGQAEQMLAKLG